jgi:hypothetical protein
MLFMISLTPRYRLPGTTKTPTCLKSQAMSTTPIPKTGQTWHLPASGNTVTITSKGRDGEMRCTYVETADRPELGGAASFSSTCLLSADYLQKYGVLRDGD